MESLYSHHRLTLLSGFTTKRAERRTYVFMRAAEASAGSKTVRGFMLIEMTVVLAIIVTITGVILTNQTSFNKTLVLANTAYDIALTLRSSQTYGLGSRAFGGAVNMGYGLHFEITSPESFTLFADVSPAPRPSNCHGLPAGGADSPNAKRGDCTYQSATERVKDYTLENNIYIQDLCIYTLSNWYCTYAHDGAFGGVSFLDVVFARPNPEPFINASINRKACITISSRQDSSQRRFILVTESGQITTSASSCLTS